MGVIESFIYSEKIIHRFLKRNAWPFFQGTTLEGYNYLEFLEDTVDPRITEILESGDNQMKNELTLHQYGALLH